MPVTEFLERNAKLYADEVALVELNPELKDNKRTTWKEYDLIEPQGTRPYRREITWSVFDEKANRFANMLIDRGIKKGDSVAIIMYNCLEWLPIYFGVLKAGAIAVPFNFRYDAEEILYCAELAEVDIIVFGPEFIGRIEQNAERLSKGRLLIYVGDNCPSFAESYRELKKVSWPNRSELFKSTMVVIVIVALTALLVFLFDTIFTWLTGWFYNFF